MMATRMDMNFSSSNINLVHRTSIAVIASLWNQHDVIADLKNLILEMPNCKSWRSIEDNVISLLHKILIPNELKLILNNLVQPMGMQIFKWICFTRSIFKVYSYLPDSLMFIWTERGILNYSKTAELIIESSDGMLCYCLACTFCIEETIFKFWSDIACVLYEKIDRNLYSVQSNAIMYWNHYLSGDSEKFMSLIEYCGERNPHELGFLSMLLDSKCVSSLGYFLKFIRPERKQILVLLALEKVFHATRPLDGNVVIFLFSHLTEYDVDQVVKKNCYYVLSSFLEWPCQEYFMPIANSSWDQLSNSDYLNLLQDLTEFVSKYYVGNIYKNLFEQFWKSSPSSFKKYVKSKCLSGTFLSRLFLHENTEEIIQMVFDDCTADERQQMIFYFEGMCLCDLLVKKEKWNSLKLLVKNCIQDQSTLQEFIKQYKTDKYFFCREIELRANILFEKIKEWY